LKLLAAHRTRLGNVTTLLAGVEAAARQGEHFATPEGSNILRQIRQQYSGLFKQNGTERVS